MAANPRKISLRLTSNPLGEERKATSSTEAAMRYTTLLYGFTVLLAGCVRDGLPTDRHPSNSGDFKSFKDHVPPELVSAPSHWVNANGAVTLEKLRGHVVWLQFNFWENCTPLRHHLVRWHNEFEHEGFVIIEIDGGRYEELDKVKSSVVRQGVKHRVLWDEDCRNHRFYGVRDWPVAYLIGRDGRVIWEGRPRKAMTREKDEQVVVDRRTRRTIRDLVVEALKEQPQG